MGFISLIAAVLALCCTQGYAANMSLCSYDPPLFYDAVKNPVGDIYTPGYEENEKHPDKLYCLYHIKAAPGYRIKLTFVDFELEAFDFCKKDALYVFDGPDRNSPWIGAFCGEEKPRPIISSTNEMHMLFYANFMAGNLGFHLRYEASANPTICPAGQVQCRNRKCYDPRQKCDGNDDCGDGTDEEKCNFPLPTIECGVTPIEPELGLHGADRIVGGTKAVEGSWPWQVDMQMALYEPNGHNCGGTLINAEWVMTALHCFGSNAFPEGWRLHIGNHHKFKTDAQEQIRYIDRIVIFPGYTGDEIIGKPIDFTHDIALVKLNAPVKFTDYVRPACLPPQGYELPLRTQCVSTGWGTTRGTGYNHILKQVELSVVPRQDCEGWFEEPTMICARNEKGFHDSCHGDSGGPLVCKAGRVWNVYGIVSFGTTTNLMTGNCALPGNGAVYNKVSAKVEWINKMIQRFT